MHHHTTFHDPVLVALSIVIAALASYTALDLATRMRAASGRARRSWLVAAAIAMGGGIWSMHFVGMLAFSLPGIEISYDPFLTLLSLVIPVVVAAAAFAVVGRRPQAPLAFLLAGITIVILSIGIAAAVYDRASAERAQREANALRRSEERFRLLVEGIVDHAIFMLDPDGRVGNWNLGARRLMGYGDDIVGTSYTIFHSEEDCAAGLPPHALLKAERDGKSATEGWRGRKD